MNNKQIFTAMIVLILLLVGVVVYMQYKTTPQVSVSLNNSQASGNLDYVNSDYGFKLKFGEAWRGYRVFKLGNDNVTSYDFCVKTTDTTYTTLNPDQAGFACPVSVFAIKDAAWDVMADLERTSFGDSAAEKQGARFFVKNWQDVPSDLQNTDLGIEAVKSSFRF